METEIRFQDIRFRDLISEIKPRGFLTMGLWTPMIIGRSGFLRVESGGGPENQDEKLTEESTESKSRFCY